LPLQQAGPLAPRQALAVSTLEQLQEPPAPLLVEPGPALFQSRAERSTG